MQRSVARGRRVRAQPFFVAILIAPVMAELAIAFVGEALGPAPAALASLRSPKCSPRRERVADGSDHAVEKGSAGDPAGLTHKRITR